MKAQKAKAVRRQRRTFRVRKSVRGTAERPRLTVFRSSKHIYAQLIDDETGRTLASASSMVKKVERAAVGYGGNVKAAKAVGQKLATAAKSKGITKAAFDRGPYKYHGRIEALADGAREGGLDLGPGRPAKAPPAKPEPAEAKSAGEKKKKGEKGDKGGKAEKADK